MDKRDAVCVVPQQRLWIRATVADPVEIQFKIDEFRVRLPDKDFPHRGPIQGRELEVVVVVGERHTLLAAQITPPVEAAGQTGYRSLIPVLIRQGYREDGVGAAESVHVCDNCFGVRLPGVEGDVGARGAEAEVVEDVAEVFGVLSAETSELDGGISYRRDPAQRARHVACGLFADGIELE